MEKRNFSRFEDMLESSKAACQYMEGKNRDDLNNNRLLFAAVVRELEIIGEAAVQISDEIKKEYNLPWREMIGMRNRLIHGYFDIDRDIVWETIFNELPRLIAELEKIIESKRKGTNFPLFH